MVFSHAYMYVHTYNLLYQAFTVLITVNDKNYTREKLSGFCAFLMNHEGF